jgi:hypothetical protein
MRSLHALLAEHGEAIEADLQRFYGLPLSDLFNGSLTPRRLAVLIRNLPNESATARDFHGEVLDWGQTEHLLALIADLLAEANWQRQGDKAKQHPKPLTRPGQTKRLALDAAEVKRRLLAQRGGN